MHGRCLTSGLVHSSTDLQSFKKIGVVPDCTCEWSTRKVFDWCICESTHRKRSCFRLNFFSIINLKKHTSARGQSPPQGLKAGENSVYKTKKIINLIYFFNNTKHINLVFFFFFFFQGWMDGLLDVKHFYVYLSILTSKWLTLSVLCVSCLVRPCPVAAGPLPTPTNWFVHCGETAHTLW